MRESFLERKLCAFAKAHGILTLKLVAMGGAQKGQPDRLLLKKGKAVFLEIKAPGRKLRPLQLRWLEKLRAKGFAAHWCDSVEERERIMRDEYDL